MKFKKVAAGALAVGMLAGYALVPNGAELFAVKASAAEGDVAINETNFPDDNFREFVSRVLDYNDDGFIDEDEILDIDYFSVVRRNIISLKGVEYFTYLKELDCSNNQITEIDLSKNTKLQKLDCSDNQITEIDLSKNYILDYLTTDKNITIYGTIGTYAEEYAKDNNLTFYGTEYSGDLIVNKCNFPNDKFREYVKENFDKDEDGTLSPEEISSVTSIDFDTSYDYSYGAVKTLKGVEFFTELTELSCSGSNSSHGQVAELDLRGLKKLTKLNCSRNMIETLNISDCTALTELDCSNNILSSLDLSCHKALTYLNCEYEKGYNYSTGEKISLGKLDLSQNTALTYLNCANDDLTKLDLSNNTALTHLTCSKNNLTELDLSKNTALTTLECNDNQLTELDLSKNTTLKDFYCGYNKLLTSINMNGCKELMYMNCEYCDINDLDVSNCKSLKRIWCHSNKLTKLDISKNKVLELLICNGNQIAELDLSQNNNLHILTTDNTITIYGVANTYPETYAKEKGIKFVEVELPEEPAVTGTITVSGKDDTTEGVSVNVTDAEGNPYDADVDGSEFSVSSLPDGVYTLTVSKSKYCPRDCTVTIAGGQMTGELDVKLQKYGDIDNTGEINISDALQIVNYRNSKTSSFDKVSGDELKYLEKLADINGDGQVNINDALQIVNFRNGKASSFDKIA